MQEIRKKNRERISVEVLVFNIQMNSYGIPVQEIDQLLDQGTLSTRDQTTVRRIDEILQIPNADVYLFPSWLKLKSSLQSSLAGAVIEVDGMTGIQPVASSRIRLLPKILRRHLRIPWIWAAALPDGQNLKDILLLLDFNIPEPLPMFREKAVGV